MSRDIVTRVQSSVICTGLRAPPESQGGSRMSDLDRGEWSQRCEDGAIVCYAAKELREGTTRPCACDL